MAYPPLGQICYIHILSIIQTIDSWGNGKGSLPVCRRKVEQFNVRVAPVTRSIPPGHVELSLVQGTVHVELIDNL